MARSYESLGMSPGRSQAEFGNIDRAGQPADDNNRGSDNQPVSRMALPASRTAALAKRKAEAERNRSKFIAQQKAKMEAQKKADESRTAIDAFAQGGVGSAMRFGNSAMRNNMIEKVEGGGTPIFDSAGVARGVVTTNEMGMSVYTGQRIAGYDGQFANLVADDVQRDENDAVEEQVVRDYGGGQLSKDKDETGVNTVLPDLPDAPGDGATGTGDASEQVKKRSKMGKASTIATTPQGLLASARTRQRSLMSGLIN